MHTPPSPRAPRRALRTAGLSSIVAAMIVAGTANSSSAQPHTTGQWTEKVAPELLAQVSSSTTRTTGAATSVRALANFASFEARALFLDTTTVEVLNVYDNFPTIMMSVDAGAVRQLATRADVSFVEDVPVATTFDSESFPLTGTDDAHAAGFTGAGTTIALIDDGIDASHEAFDAGDAFPNDKVIGGADFADNDDDPSIDCVDQSHGTATAGVAAANGGGITGTAPDAQVVMVKVQSAGLCGSSSLDGDLIGAIDWVVSNGDALSIDVLSMSLGYGSYRGSCDSSEPALASAVNAATNAGILVFAASGNGAQKSAMSAPACLSGAISVGAVYDANIGSTRFQICSDRTTAPDRVTCYSNSDSGLDLLAPSNNAFTAQSGGGSTSTFGGTSSATPFAAGVAADLIAAGASPSQVLSILRSTGRAVTDPANNRTTPRVDTLAAVQSV
jgi:subtilisin family serine protease